MKTKLTLAMIIISFTGCYYDKEELLYGVNAPCATTNVTYSVTVSGILNNNGCLNCHAGNSPSGNINLQGYTNVRAAAANGSLFGAINHSGGFTPMPLGGNKMAPCDINKVKAWIDAGMVNN